MAMFTDKINELWLERTDRLANELEQTGDQTLLSKFTNDQLTYLAYWNFGVSGAAVMPETRMAEEELVRRGSPYDQEIAEAINEETEKYY